jgi:hypothetical protein
MADDNVLDDVYTTTPNQKLDADHFKAEDIDGVTESLFGSGSVGYASLQAAQTDAAIENNFEFNTKNYAGDTNISTSEVIGTGAEDLSNNIADSIPQDERGITGEYGSPLSTNASTINDTTAQEPTNSVGGGADINMLATATSGAGMTTAPDGVGDVSTTINRVVDTDDAPAQPVDDIQSVIPDIALPDIELVNDTDVSTLLDTGLMTEAVEGVVSGASVDAVDDVITNINTTVGEILNQGVEAVVDIASTVTDNDSVEQILSTVNNASDTVDNAVFSSALDSVLPISSDGSDTNVSVVDSIIVNTQDAVNSGEAEGVADTISNVDADAVVKSFNVVNDSQLDSDSGISEILNPIADTTDTIIKDEITEDVLSNVNDIAPVLDDIPQTSSGNQDTDISASISVDIETNIDAVDTVIADVQDVVTPEEVEINAVEDIVGDVDIEATVEMTPTVDTQDNGSDINVQTDVDVLNTDSVSVNVNAPIDSVETIAGDIDINIDVATDVLGDGADDIVDSGDGGSMDESITADTGDVLSEAVEPIIEPIVNETPSIEIDLDVSESLAIIDNVVADTSNSTDAQNTTTSEESLWADSSLSDSTGMFDDIAGGANDAIGGVLPDPAGDISEGLGALDIDSNIGDSGLGGLF